MSTFFLQRGIRLNVSTPRDLSIRDVEVPNDSGPAPPLRHPALSERIVAFAAEQGTHVVIRLADVDPFSQTQRAVTEQYRDNLEQLTVALRLLSEKTGMSHVYMAAHKGQNIGAFEKLAHRVLRVSHRHYPMLSTPCIAQKLLPGIPVLTREGQVRGILVVDVTDLMSLLDPDGKQVLTVVAPGNVECVRIPRGTTVLQLCHALWFSAEVKQVVMGSPLMGVAISDMSTPIDSDTLTFSLHRSELLYQNLPCCNCGKCVKVCPSRLLPGLLSKHIYVENFEVARQLNVHSCIECGCCAYMCPSTRPLVQYMRLGKQEGVTQ